MTGLSFLGTGNYTETTYVYGDKAVTSAFFPAALKELFEVHDLAVVMTKEAKEKHGDTLSALTDYREIMIPSGAAEEEYFEMFDIIVDAIPSQSELVVDVTHGFRSQPMIALSSVLFMRIHKQTKIKGIYYGAHESRDVIKNRSPVFDLAPFLDIIDWAYALRRFSEKGDAGSLGELMKKLHIKTHKDAALHPSQSLLNLGNYLNSLMNSLSVVRPAEVMNEAAHIYNRLDNVVPDLENIAQTRPLALLFDDIRATVETFFAGDEASLFSTNGIRIQTNMLRHYMLTGSIQQALTLAVELIITIACLRKGVKPDDLMERKAVKDRLFQIALKKEHTPAEEWESEMAGILALASEYRNDLNHAGMRIAPKPAKKMISQTEAIIEQTTRIANQYIKTDAS